MSTMEQWTAAVCADLGLDPSSADLTTVLDLTRDVAHGVARPAAPVTAYLVGVAVGRGLALPDAAARIAALAAGWAGAAGNPGLSARTGWFGVLSLLAVLAVTGLLQISPSPGARWPDSSKTVSRGGRRRAKGGR